MTLLSSLRLRTSVALAACLAAAPMAGAQDGGDDIDLDMGTPVEEGESGLGDAYVLEISGDWEIRCVRTELEHDPCALHQLLQDQQGNAVATIEIVNLPEGREAAAGATIVTPLETLLTRQITLSVDGGTARRYPFTFCTQAGCVARVGFTQVEVDTFRRGAVARLTIYPAGAPETPEELDASLTGFTDGYARIEELNALNTEAATAAQESAAEE